LIFGGLMLVGYAYFRFTHDAEISSADGELVKVY
jgi:ethanolamine permease